MLIYAYQFGMFWRMTPEDAIGFLDHAIEGGDWFLDDWGTPLSRKPPYIYKRGSMIEATKPNQFVFSPLDMDKEDLEDTKERLVTFIERYEEQ